MTAFGPYPARVVDVHDGDTVVLDIDLGFDHLISGRDWDGRTRLSCRVFGINAPELVTAAGKAARAYAQEFLAPGDRVTVVSYGWDKYGGRFDGDVRLADGRSFADIMVSGGHAQPLKGVTR
jgi:endonuclease YncB( thermonuclease family)